MDLRNAELFCDVVTRRSFSKAAEANHISQSAVSQAVHVLEERFGTRLIDRSKRPLDLTAAGQVYFDGCRKLLEAFREMEDSVQRIGNRIAGRLRIASIYSVGLLQMHEYVREYRSLYPDVELTIDYLHPGEIYDRVLNDDADIGLVSFPRAGGEMSSISWQVQPMGLVVEPGHPLAGECAISVRRLDGERFVGFSSQLTICRQISRWLREAKVTVNVVHEFDNVENIKRAVEIGAGVTILPVATLRREIEAGTLVLVPFGDVDWYRPLGIVHKRHKTLTTPASKFVELLQQANHEAPAGEEPPNKRNNKRGQKNSSPTESCGVRSRSHTTR